MWHPFMEILVLLLRAYVYFAVRQRRSEETSNHAVLNATLSDAIG